MTKATIVGVAAHITAAAEGGPRYDESLTKEERRHITNGIWLCAHHATMIDKDPESFPVELLHEWKATAEEIASSELQTNTNVDPDNYQRFVLPYLKMEPDNTFRHFGGKVTFDTFSTHGGMVIVRLKVTGDVDEKELQLLGNLAVRAYLGQHLTHGHYMQMLMIMRNRRLHRIAHTFPDGQDENFSRFEAELTEIDWSPVSIP